MPFFWTKAPNVFMILLKKPSFLIILGYLQKINQIEMLGKKMQENQHTWYKMLNIIFDNSMYLYFFIYNYIKINLSYASLSHYKIIATFSSGDN